MAEGTRRPAWAGIDLAAIRHNAAVLASIAAPARLCAVVKADAYGHGATEVARAALAGGASELAVALVDEGVELREAGIDAPILVLSEPGPDAMTEVYSYGLVPTVYTEDGLAGAANAARALASRAPASRAPALPAGGRLPVEIKVDTGMHRVGADPGCVVQLVAGLVDRLELGFGGLWTHLAVADEPERGATAEQLGCFEAVRESLRAAGLAPPQRLHAANTAGAIAWPSARFDMVRCGIGLYGYSPSRAVAPALASEVVAAGWEDGLRPALSWAARVSMVRELEAGERVSYGLRQPLPARSLVATVPLGYADGIPRSYFTGGGVVLVNGRRRPLAGTVTMDQILVDCGDDSRVSAGDEVVLIGEQGDERLTADDWADVLGTISYEVVTRIGPRVRRVYHGGCGPAPATGAAESGPGEAGRGR
ncbi:MAG: alanine racemase [Acidimicrobiales bacterium]